MVTEKDDSPKSQAQELQEWLDNEIAKVSDDVSTLSQMLFHQRAHPNHGHSTETLYALALCCNMLSEEREKAIKDNEEKLERRKERLDSLRLAQAFKFEDCFPELNRVFGVRCTFDFEEKWPKVPPIVQWSPRIYNLEERVTLDFLLTLSKRTLTVRHNILKEGKVFAFSNVELPNLCSVRVSKWPEIILFVFEDNGERRYLHFSKTGLWVGGNYSCFLK